MCEHNKGGCWSHKQLRSWGLLALRLAVGGIFIYAGYNKLFVTHSGVVGMLTNLKFPAPEFLAWVLGLVEFIGGAMVLLGILAPLAAIVLAVDMIIALLTAHRGQNFPQMYAPIALLGATLALAGAGAGRYRLLKYQCYCKKCKSGGSCNCNHEANSDKVKSDQPPEKSNSI